MFLIIRFKFVVSLMCMTFCLIIKCILEKIFMQFYTYKVLGTEMSPFRWNGSYIPIEVLYFISLPLSQKFEEQLN